MSAKITVKGDGNETAGRDINKFEFKPFIWLILFLVMLLIGGIFYFYIYPDWSKLNEEAKISFCDEDAYKTNINILVLPFNSYLETPNIKSDCQGQVINELNEIKSLLNLPIEVKSLTLMEYNPNGEISLANEIGEDRCSKIVLWGSCNEVDGNIISSIKVSIIGSNFSHGIFDKLESYTINLNQLINSNNNDSLSSLQKLSIFIGALVHYENGDYKKSEELLSKVEVEGLGNDCFAIQNYLNWATIFLDLGEAKKSESLAKKALKISEQNLCNRKEKATILDRLSTIHSYHFGEYEKAIEFSNQAIRIIESMPTIEDSLLGLLYTNLVTPYKLQNEHDTALGIQEKALKLFRSSTTKSNSNDWSISQMLYNISSINRNMGKYIKALEYGKEALEIQSKVLPNSHETIATSIENLSKIYWRMGDMEKSMSLLKEVQEIRENILPETHIDLVHSFHNYAVIANNNFIDIEGGLFYEKKAIKVIQAQSPIDSARLAKAYKQLFSIYKNLNKLEDGKKQLDRAFEINLKVNMGNRLAPSMLYYFNDYTYYYFVKEEYEIASVMLDTAFLILQRLAPDKVSLLNNNRAMLLARTGKCDESMNLVNGAFDMLKKSDLPETHQSYYDVYLTIAEVNKCNGDFVKAIENSNKLITYYDTLIEKSFSTKIRFAETLYFSALIHCEIGERKKALALNERAIQLIENGFPDGYHLIDKIKAHISQVEKLQGCSNIK